VTNYTFLRNSRADRRPIALSAATYVIASAFIAVDVGLVRLIAFGGTALGVMVETRWADMANVVVKLLPKETSWN
jgi:hypothetical protein